MKTKITIKNPEKNLQLVQEGELPRKQTLCETDIPDNIHEIAAIIKADWKNIYFGAVPYLDAMASINSVHSGYFLDSAKSIVNYFLANATSWRGDKARAVKSKLRKLISQAE
ncbi:MULTISPECIES: hypothetical protein [Sphingobacterium]|uniref:hypothetical protein n=1 Tax=Sphingobacterium TaxID=28453 RepID=UPI00257D8C95|nr:MULTISPECIES: hypothetical protein [Sphingobacterium]